MAKVKQLERLRDEVADLREQLNAASKALSTIAFLHGEGAKGVAREALLRLATLRQAGCEGLAVRQDEEAFR